MQVTSGSAASGAPDGTTGSLFPWPSSDAALLACTASSWEGDETRCRWCDKTLSGRQRRWCSHECANLFGRNHWWSWASKAAKKRDGNQCIECKQDPLIVFAAKVEAGWSEDAARKFMILETDHVEQILGRHAQTGCHHHLDGLRTLCAHHHLERHHGPRQPTHEQLRVDAA